MRSLYIIGVTLAALLATAMVASIGDDEHESDDQQWRLSMGRTTRLTLSRRGSGESAAHGIVFLGYCR